MMRREFIALLGGAAVAWPVAAQAQQERERVRRIGIFSPVAADSPEGRGRLTAFLQGLQELGGRTDATSGSIIAWRKAMPNACGGMRRT